MTRRLDALPRDGLVIVHGGARGADRLAGAWAHDRGVTEEIHPADWAAHGRAAGPIRNAEMLASGVDLVLAFRSPGESRGTDHMVSIARKAGVGVEVHHGPSSAAGAA